MTADVELAETRDYLSLARPDGRDQLAAPAITEVALELRVLPDRPPQLRVYEYRHELMQLSTDRGGVVCMDPTTFWRWISDRRQQCRAARLAFNITQHLRRP